MDHAGPCAARTGVRPIVTQTDTDVSDHSLSSSSSIISQRERGSTYVLRRYVRPLAGTNELTLLVTAQYHCDAYAASLPVK